MWKTHFLLRAATTFYSQPHLWITVTFPQAVWIEILLKSYPQLFFHIPQTLCINLKRVCSFLVSEQETNQRNRLRVRR